ncbi:MAG TPA: hypothetical protein VMA74_20165, partial [Dyella sp.]|uniref:hypothetical protein n=1 Tax=Dyella sp. TaxID=1869338 RepID=UPI002CD1918C
RRSIGITLLLVLAAAVVWWRRSGHEHRPVPFNQGTAIVLPADVNAPEDWKWLRLGLMDLFSNDLRAAHVPVESSQTVLELLDRTDTEGPQRFAAFALVIRPRVSLADNVWHVHLDATSAQGRTWQAEASSDNVLKAARLADDLLLPQIGFAARHGGLVTGDTREEYLMRIEAAEDAGSVDAERELIDKAPPAVREMPEFDLAKASFHCNLGEYAPCKQGLADLLQRLPANEQPVLRGRVLAQQYYVYFREHKYAEGAAALTEAVQLLQKQKNTVYLAFAYAQRGELEELEYKFDQAQSDFGLARVNYALAGHTVGALSMDESMAHLAMQRGQYAQALPVIERAYDTYQRMGMSQFLAYPLQDRLISQRMLLQFRDELATTDRYWPLEQKHLAFTEQVERHILAYERAHALADNGRTREAGKLLEQLLAEIEADPKGEPGLQDTVYVLLAKLALEQDDIQASQAWMAKALVPALLKKGNETKDYVNALLTNVMVMQRAGKPKELADAVAAMQAWAAGSTDEDEAIAILLLRAQATEAWSEGQRDRALDQLKLAMSKADAFGVPEYIVDVGQAYAQALLIAGKVEEAASVSGKLSPWGQSDWRAAWTQACVYRALGQAAYAEPYLSKARELAGDRVLPADASVFVY